MPCAMKPMAFSFGLGAKVQGCGFRRLGDLNLDQYQCHAPCSQRPFLMVWGLNNTGCGFREFRFRSIPVPCAVKPKGFPSGTSAPERCEC